MRLRLLLSIFFVLSFVSTNATAAADSFSDKDLLVHFYYLDRDCCSCSIEPNLCTGGSYLSVVERKINYAWMPAVPNKGQTIKVKFRIHDNGDVSRIRLSNTKDTPLSRSAMKAIQDAAPFNNMPEGAPEFVDAVYTFPNEEKHISNIMQKRQILQEHTPRKYAPYLTTLLKTIRNKTTFSLMDKPQTDISLIMDEHGNLSEIKQDSPSVPDEQILKLIVDSSPVKIASGLPRKIKVKFTFDPTVREPYISKAEFIQP